MLGSQLYKTLKEKYRVIITLRNTYKSVSGLNFFDPGDVKENVDALDFDSVTGTIVGTKPDVVINCIGLIKQLPISRDPLSAITINALLPHRISHVCSDAKTRMIHISTDCVFSGIKGNYSDGDVSDAEDLYGRTKYLGEVNYKPHTITLRTSIIGHELNSRNGLVEWFLNEKGPVQGYTKALFSGFTTYELSKIISDYIIPNKDLTGVYNISANTISKYELLQQIKQIYKKNTIIIPEDKTIIDRSLNSNALKNLLNYSPPDWKQLISEMKASGEKHYGAK
jgi:dTDP-4-dehydrorhamnose reductase